MPLKGSAEHCFYQFQERRRLPLRSGLDPEEKFFTKFRIEKRPRAAFLLIASDHFAGSRPNDGEGFSTVSGSPFPLLGPDE